MYDEIRIPGILVFLRRRIRSFGVLHLMNTEFYNVPPHASTCFVYPMYGIHRRWDDMLILATVLFTRTRWNAIS